MKKYFSTTDARDTDNANIFMFMHNADKHPDDFIRICLNEENMLLSFKGRNEYRISRAMTFFWDHEAVMRFDFEPDDPDSWFYAAVDPKNGIAVRLSTPEHDLEGFNTFGPNTGFFGIFMTDEGTIFITYDGSESARIGYSYLPEDAECPRVMDQMELLFNLFRTCLEELENDETETDDDPDETDADEE